MICPHDEDQPVVERGQFDARRDGGDGDRAGFLPAHPVALLRRSLRRLRGLGLGRLDSLLALGQEGLSKRFVKVVAVCEVSAAVLSRFSPPPPPQQLLNGTAPL